MTKLTTAQQAEVDRRVEEALRERAKARLSCKVSEKGALSVYGLGRFPVTLYKGQWVAVLDYADDIRAFIKANPDSLKSKKAA